MYWPQAQNVYGLGWFTSTICRTSISQGLHSDGTFLAGIPNRHLQIYQQAFKQVNLAIPAVKLSGISKTNVRSGRMALSEWTRYVIPVWDRPGAANSMPGINTLHRVDYHPPIAVSLLRIALLVFYLKRTLRHCGQLWTYHRMDLWCWRLGHVCNAMGDVGKLSSRVTATCSQ